MLSHILCTYILNSSLKNMHAFVIILTVMYKREETCSFTVV